MADWESAYAAWLAYYETEAGAATKSERRFAEAAFLAGALWLREKAAQECEAAMDVAAITRDAVGALVSLNKSIQGMKLEEDE